MFIVLKSVWLSLHINNQRALFFVYAAGTFEDWVILRIDN